MSKLQWYNFCGAGSPMCDRGQITNQSEPLFPHTPNSLLTGNSNNCYRIKCEKYLIQSLVGQGYISVITKGS